MSVTDQLLRNNEHYAGSFTKGSLPLPPAKGVAVVACMDARLDLHDLLGLDEGDAHVIRNAGGAITDRPPLDALAERSAGGAVVDITAELAVPLPIQLIAQLLGLPPGDEQRLFRWSEAAIPGATDWPEDERMALLGEMTVELLGLAAARRAEPRDDVVSMLATYEDDGESLSDDELGMFLIQLLVAGNETTRNAISGALVALAEHPEQLDRLAAELGLKS